MQVALQGLTGHETAKGTPTGTRTGPKVHGRDPDRGHELREGVCEAEPSTMQSSIFSKNVLVVPGAARLGEDGAFCRNGRRA